MKTNYTIYENVSPLACSYNLNNGSWVEITSDLGNGTAQTTIPSELILQENTIQFQESSIYSTRFQWMLLIPVQNELETHYKEFEYDLYGNLISASNCYGTVSFEYSTEYESAYLTAVVDPVGNTISCAYDNSGNIISITDARGYTSAYEYDLLNRLTKKINPDLTEKEAVYDDINNKVTIYDEFDHAVTKYFDGLGRITKSVYGPYIEEYTYNYLEKIETRTDPLQLVYTYEYDSMGRILKTYNPDGTYTSTVYNDLQNTVQIHDENLSRKEYAYDWNGNLISVKEYTNQYFYLTEYTYNESGNITRMKDAKGNTTLYKYGMFGLTRIIYPDATEEHFNYDCIGNVIEKMQGTRTIQYHYNAASQLIEVEYPDSSVTFTYDPNGNRTSMVDTASSVISIYDSRNQLISETKTIDSTEYTTSYNYDAASNLVSITYPDGTIIEQEHDSLNRITAVNQYAQFLWNGNAQPEQITYQNGVTTDYVYDLRSRPTEIRTTKNDSDLLHLTYTYDPAGNILQMKNSEENGTQTIKEQWDYTYDNLNRLLTAVGDPGDGYSLQYEYDSVGNRIEMNNIQYTYNNMNELLSIDSESGSPASTPWWDSSYTYRREITFGQNHDVIPEGSTRQTLKL
ncbi:MAG: RHS repeat protein [Theionarchaea archaeon]|nr:RHS repeat protein [Theionarchaea archaeon]